MHEAFVSWAYRLKGAMELSQLSDPELADVGYLCREIAQLTGEDFRKEAKARAELIGSVLCAKAARRAAAGSSDVAIKGRLCTATPDVGVRYLPPTRGTDEHAKLMAWLGVSETFARAGAVEVNYNRMNELLTEMAAEGKAAPRDVLQTVPTNKVTYRKKREPKR